jgi:phage baseplate assembly protein gpV
MSQWLDVSNSANKLRQTYIAGFLDVSGSRVSVRNNAPVELYGKGDVSTPQFSMNSEKATIYDGATTYYDVSLSKLIYVKDVSENIQERLTDLTKRTQEITTDTSNNVTINSNVTVSGDFFAHFPFATIPQSAIIGGVGGIYIPTETTTFDSDNFATIKTYEHRDTVIDASVNGKLSVTGDSTFTGNVFMQSGVVFSGDVSMIGNIHASTYPLEDSSDKLATTAYVQNTLFRQFQP